MDVIASEAISNVKKPFFLVRPEVAPNLSSLAITTL